MNILITGAFEKDDIDTDFFLNNGFTVFYEKDEREPISCNPEIIDCVICNSLFVYNDISKFNNLKYIQTTSAGLDRIPLDYCKEHGIVVNNAKGVYSIPMAEFAVFSVLEVIKCADFFKTNRDKKQWNKNRELIELNDLTISIIGCGSVGTECAKRFKAFNCKVFGVDLKPFNNQYFDKIFSLSCLNEILKNSDIVLITVPLTEKTYHLINKNNIMCFKDGSILVNISRGCIIDTNSLIKESPRFKAIILDVFEEEPLKPDNVLWNIENVYIYPHNSFVGNNNKIRLKTLVYKNLTVFIHGQK